MAQAYNRVKRRDFPYSIQSTATTKYVNCGTNDAFNFNVGGDFSVITWVNSNIGNYSAFKRRSTTGWVISQYASGGIDFFMNNGGNLNYRTNINMFSGWACIVCIFRSNTREIWINGVLIQTSGAVAGSISAVGEQLNYNLQASTGITTAVGPSRIYNRALTTTEIQDYYWYAIEPSRTNLLLEYNLTSEGGSGTTVTDSSGNHYDGTFVSTPTWITDSAFKQVTQLPALSRLHTRNIPYSLRGTLNGHKVTVGTSDTFNFDKNTDLTVLYWGRYSDTILYRRTTIGYTFTRAYLGPGVFCWRFFTNHAVDGNKVYDSGVRIGDSWSQPTFVLRSGVKEIWVNGVLDTGCNGIANINPFGSFANPGTALSYAYSTATAGEAYYHGPIKIYGRALSAAEIQDFYFKGKDPARTNLLLEYNLTEGATTSTADTSGNGFTGTLSTAALWNTDSPMKSRGQSAARFNMNIIADGDMEAVGVANWDPFVSAVLTKETGTPHNGTRCLRVAYGGSSGPFAGQTILKAGGTYRITGWARGDGTYVPKVGNWVDLWTGTSSNSWQPFDVTFAFNTNGVVYLKSTATAAGYCEFDDVAVRRLS